jgi:hypothetical protein
MNKEEVLKELGFEEKKPNLWHKAVELGWAHWDFRKIKKGRFYIAVDGGGFLDDAQAKEYSEYIDFRELIDQESKKEPKKVNIVSYDDIKHKVEGRFRGNEEEISMVVKSRRLDVISKVSKDGMGEGILYHNLGSKIGFEPSAELVDMIACDMGNIETQLVEHGKRNHIFDETGEIYQTYYAIVRATDKVTGTTGLGSAEAVMDYDEMDKNKRTFAMTLAVRKAERNAKERLIPVPRKALVELVKSLVKERKK